ncbi:unnamed protein product [Prorocentrum cordatum]|uniref:Protein S-acyltransferase n=1 Tax=Prorocentrum cordatum TaxID=2364126 RepID=A0ABN9T0A5_9DINO|nr:unnamed protein product [Polarella glacialis]
MGRPRQQRMRSDVQAAEEEPGAPAADAGAAAAAAKEERKKDKAAITQGLALGRVIWREHDLCGDLWFFIKNNDAILGMLFCHEMHPYTRPKRIIVKICGMAANFGMACLFLDLNTCKKVEGEITVLDTVECEQHQSDAVQFASISCAVLVSALLFLMYWLYTCRCARKGGPLHYGKKTESFWVCCTKPITGSLNLVCLIILIAGLIAHGESSVSFADSYVPQVWVTSEIYSIVMGFCLQVAIFFSLYCGCECCPGLTCLFQECWGSGQAGGARPSFAYPYGDEYPKDMEAFWRGDRSCGTYGYQSDAPPAAAPSSA